MFCKNCGASIPQGASFCSQCGARAAGPEQVAGGVQRGLTRARQNRVIAGVCAGLHNYYGWDTSLVRVVFVLTAIVLFPLGIVAYAAAWVLVPEDPLLLPMSVPPPTSVSTNVPPGTI
jgi:phage shock protein C